MKIWTIARWEFARFFKWKQELFSLGILVLIMGVMLAWDFAQPWIDPPKRIAWVSQAPAPEVADHSLQPVEPQPLEPLLTEWDLVVQPMEYGFRVASNRQRDWHRPLLQQLQQQRQIEQISSLSLPPEQQHWVTQLPDIEWVGPAAEPPERDSGFDEVWITMLLIAMAVGAFTGFGYLFATITKEKQQRVTEQILTLVTPGEWLDGKVLGISLHCLKSGVTVCLYFIVAMQAGVWFLSGELVPITLSIKVLLGLPFIAAGLLLMNALMGAFAATIDDPNHSGKTYLMFVPMLPIGLAFTLSDKLSEPLGVWLSLIPLTSFAVMPMRLVTEAVPLWQLAASFAALLLLIGLVRRLAHNLFTLGIRTYGQEPGLRQILTFLIGWRSL